VPLTRPQSLSSDRGFSFIELLAYIVIAALLMMAAIPQFNNYRAKATIHTMLDDAHAVGLAVEALDDRTEPAVGAALSAVPLSGANRASRFALTGNEYQVAITNPAVDGEVVYSSYPTGSIKPGVNYLRAAEAETPPAAGERPAVFATALGGGRTGDHLRQPKFNFDARVAASDRTVEPLRSALPYASTEWTGPTQSSPVLTDVTVWIGDRRVEAAATGWTMTVDPNWVIVRGNEVWVDDRSNASFRAFMDDGTVQFRADGGALNTVHFSNLGINGFGPEFD